MKQQNLSLIASVFVILGLVALVIVCMTLVVNGGFKPDAMKLAVGILAPGYVASTTQALVYLLKKSNNFRSEWRKSQALTILFLLFSFMAAVPFLMWGQGFNQFGLELPTFLLFLGGFQAFFVTCLTYIGNTLFGPVSNADTRPKLVP